MSGVVESDIVQDVTSTSTSKGRHSSIMCSSGYCVLKFHASTRVTCILCCNICTISNQATGIWFQRSAIETSYGWKRHSIDCSARSQQCGFISSTHHSRLSKHDDIDFSGQHDSDSFLRGAMFRICCVTLSRSQISRALCSSVEFQSMSQLTSTLTLKRTRIPTHSFTYNKITPINSNTNAGTSHSCEVLTEWNVHGSGIR